MSTPRPSSSAAAPRAGGSTEAGFVARYGLGTVSAPIEDWNFLRQQYSDTRLDEEGLDKAVTDFKAAQEEDVNEMLLEEVPPSPYATPGEGTPAGSTPQGEFNWVKGRVRDLYHKVHELLGSGVADAQATASSAASTRGRRPQRVQPGKQHGEQRFDTRQDRFGPGELARRS
ncbi:hypothetical protein THAOC_23221, partial [Thalassiosira oceanica]